MDEFATFLSGVFGGIEPVAALALFWLIIMLLAALAGFAFSGGLKKIARGRDVGNGPPLIAGGFAIVTFFIGGVAGFLPLAMVVGSLLAAIILAFLFKRFG